jgi:hypothetical protein
MRLPRTLALVPLLLVAGLGCASRPADAARAEGGVVVGVCQVGGVPITRPDGAPLLSEAYVLYPDGQFALTENYGDAPAHRLTRTTEAQTRKLIALLRSPAWQSLAAEPASPPGPDAVRVTIETEGKTVTRWSGAQEPIVRQVIVELQRLRAEMSGT